jgi:hypothetical protein
MKVKKNSSSQKVDSGRGKSYSSEYPYGRRHDLSTPTKALRRRGLKMTDENLMKYSGLDVSGLDSGTRMKARV